MVTNSGPRTEKNTQSITVCFYTKLRSYRPVSVSTLTSVHCLTELDRRTKCPGLMSHVIWGTSGGDTYQSNIHVDARTQVSEKNITLS